MKKSIKKLLALVLCALMLASLVACGGQNGESGNNDPGTSSPGSTPAAPQIVPQQTGGEMGVMGIEKPVSTTKDSLVLQVQMDPGTMDPYTFTFGPQLVFTTMAVETLFLYNVDGIATPLLAESYEFGAGNMNMTVKLREGVKFHNGDTMTTADVAFSIDKALDAQGTKNMMSAVKDYEVVDDYTIIINFKYPCGTAADVLTNLFVVNKNVYDGEHDANAGFTGTGPFAIVKWDPGIGCTYKAFEDYWEGAPLIKNLDVQIITESSVRMVNAENGDSDIYRAGATNDIARVADGSSPGLKLWKADRSQAIHYMGFNVTKAPMNDVRVRQAICYAIDSTALVYANFDNIGEPSNSILPQKSWYSPTIAPEYTYEFNPEKAKELLAEAGYPDGIKLKMYLDANAYRIAMAEMLPSMLRQSGIEIEVVQMDSTAYSELMLNATDYDVFLRNHGNLSEPSAALRVTLTAQNGPGGNGYFHYADEPYAAEIDEHLNNAASLSGIEERAAEWQAYADVFAENALIKPIMDYYDVNIVAENLHNMYFSPNINVQYAYFD